MQKEFSQQQFVLGWYNDAHLRSQAFNHSSWSHLKLQFSCPHSLAYSSILVSHSFRLHHWSTRTHAIPVTREAIPTHTQIFTTKASESHPTSHPFPAMDGSCSHITGIPCSNASDPLNPLLPRSTACARFGNSTSQLCRILPSAPMAILLIRHNQTTLASPP